MTNVSDAVLSSSIKELMASGIISRRSYDETPPRVEYRLTEKGTSVVPVLQEICRWAGMFHREVAEGAPRQCQMCDYTREV